MKNKLRMALLAAVALVLAAAIYLGVTLALSPAARAAQPGRPGNAALIPATELPPTQPDLFGQLVEKRDHSLMLRPITKGPNDASNPLVEVVVAANTTVYLDTTSEQTSPIVNGTIQQTLAAFDFNQMAPPDTVVAWGTRRGDRLTADVLVDERNH